MCLTGKHNVLCISCKIHTESISSPVKILMTSFPTFSHFLVQTVSLSIIIMKKIHLWLEDMNFFYFLVLKTMFHSLAMLARSDEGLTLETPASEYLYGGQFTLSTQLIKPNYLILFLPLKNKIRIKMHCHVISSIF